jgi:leader peptidase (prepilin peptidase)/N-methyltransferase
MNTLFAIADVYIAFFLRHPDIFILISAILGLLIGSFLNVVALRVPNKESLVYPPSHCVHCKHRLSALDLIPVFSYLFLSGSCRYCKARISLLYPIGELLTCLWFAIMAAWFGPTPDLLVGLFFVTIMVAVTLTDLKYMLIPDRIVFFAIAGGIIVRLIVHPLPIWQYAAGFFIGGGLLYVIAWASEHFLKKEGMGGGDIKLFAFVGLMLGPGYVMLVLFVASLLGTLIGVLLLIGRRMGRERQLPFAPFIAASTLMVYIWGNGWIQAYMNLITSSH